MPSSAVCPERRRGWPGRIFASATALGVRNLVVEVPAKQTMDDTARNELRNTLSASGVEHAVFWDDAAGIFQ